MNPGLLDAAPLLQAAPWYVVLRDIMIILAAAALVLSSLMMVWVGWQLWRLGKQLRDEAHPIVAAVQDIADTVGDAVDFIGTRLSTLQRELSSDGPAEGKQRGRGVSLRHVERAFGRKTPADGGRTGRAADTAARSQPRGEYDPRDGSRSEQAGG